MMEGRQRSEVGIYQFQNCLNSDQEGHYFPLSKVIKLLIKLECLLEDPVDPEFLQLLQNFGYLNGLLQN